MDGLRQELRRLSESASPERAGRDQGRVREVVFNLKLWDADAPSALLRFVATSPRLAPLRLSRQNGRLTCVAEEPGTVVGSGAAIVNSLLACNLSNSHPSNSTSSPPSSSSASASDRGAIARGDDRPGMALLMAGEGSRLWGVSAALGFVKGLSNVLGVTLLEQTVRQLLYILDAAPGQGKGMTIVAGTDNILLPSSLSILAPGGSIPFSHAIPRDASHAGGPNNNLFFFSKRIAVLDEKFQVIDEEVLQELTQLGVMLVDERTSHPLLFLEKAGRDEILAVLRERKQRAVFFNVFYFAFTNPAARKVVELYAHTKTAAAGIPFYMTNEFDWSGHFIEPLTIESFEAWQARWTAKQKAYFPDKNDWDTLYHLAQAYKREFGLPVVVSVGEDAIFYDTGMSTDLKKLYELAVSSSNPEMRDIIRTLFSCPTDKDVIGSKLDKPVRLAGPREFIVMNSVFKKGGSVGKGSIVVNSTFEEETHVPENTIVVDSHITSLAPGSEPESLVYSFNNVSSSSADHSPLLLRRDFVHFSAFAKPRRDAPAAESRIISGVFPLHVNAKDKPTQKTPKYLDHYNVGSNAGKAYLEQTMLGLPEPLSFKQLMVSRRISLEKTLSFLAAMRAAKVHSAAL